MPLKLNPKNHKNESDGRNVSKQDPTAVARQLVSSYEQIGKTCARVPT